MIKKLQTFLFFTVIIISMFAFVACAPSTTDDGGQEGNTPVTQNLPEKNGGSNGTNSGDNDANGNVDETPSGGGGQEETPSTPQNPTGESGGSNSGTPNHDSGKTGTIGGVGGAYPDDDNLIK